MSDLKVELLTAYKNAINASSKSVTDLGVIKKILHPMSKPKK